MLDQLGIRQQQAVDGPDGPTIAQFVCAICDKKCYDITQYFGGAPSTRCMWCIKYNKKPKVSKITTEQMVDPKG
jgi:hypothetical protein